MNISIKDIAQALNLSHTTVSWVLSGRGDEKRISLRTQERVKKYAEEHDYRPNLVAKNLICGKSNTIGLIIPLITDDFFAHIAREVELAAEKHGYSLTFCSSNNDTERESQIIDMLISKGVDGLIITPTHNSVSNIKKLRDSSFPFILIDRFFPELDTGYVVVDNEGCSADVVGQLIKNGKRKIAVVTVYSDLSVIKMRYRGYLNALNDASIPMDPDLIINFSRTVSECEFTAAMDKLLQRVPDVDGFYFTTHFLAFEGLRYFYEHNIDITDRIDLACFHSNPALKIMAPQMITTRMPIQSISQYAVNILVDSIESKEVLNTKIVLPTIHEF